MPFQIQPATYSDLDALADIIVSSHVKDELVPLMMGNVPHQVQVKWYADALRKVWQEDKGVRYYEAIEEETHKIVAMARFHYPRNMTAAEKNRVESSPFGPLPEGSNVEFCHEFFEKLEVYESKYIDRENTFFVNFLATLPEYHRKGIGKQLIDVCLQDAAEAQADTFLIATPTGSGLYKKLGFQEIDRVTWDTVPHGGDGVVTWLCMIKQPNFSQVNGSAAALQVTEHITVSRTRQTPE